MRINSEQFSSYLEKLQPVYSLFGTESLLVDSTLTSLYTKLNEHGFEHKIRFDIAANTSFDPVWNEYHNISLFSPKKIIEIKLASTTTKITNQLKELVTKTKDDIILVLVFSEITWQQQKSQWFNVIDKHSLMIEHITITPQMMPKWIAQTMRSMDISLSDSLVQLISRTNAYNILGAYNELKKIELLYEKDVRIDEKNIEKHLENNSKYSVYNLIDTALKGNVDSTIEIYAQKNYEPMHLVNMLYIQITQLITIHLESKTLGLENAISKERVWKTKVNIIKSALKNNAYPKLQKLLLQLGRVERAIKGRDSIIPEQKLLDILLQLAR